MGWRMRVLGLGAVLWMLGAVLSGCGRSGSGPSGQPAQSVVVYTSLDEPYSRPVFDRFTRETGIEVRAVYDLEAHKSRGLAQRILAERNRPRADAFWSSEILQMLMLQREGVLEPYRSPAAEEIPARYRDPDGHWTGFAARFRVLAYHRELVSDPPAALEDLTQSRWRGKVAMANPLFGTTTTEAAALFQVLGPEPARRFYEALRQNQVRIVDGNSVTADQAARGEVLVGMTDTDDAYVRVDAGAPLEVVFPDQEGIGALLIPNTAALVRGGPNPDAARRFLDYLLRPETELMLAELPARQLPLHPSVRERLPDAVRPLLDVRQMQVDYARLGDDYEEINRFLRDLFLQ